MSFNQKYQNQTEYFKKKLNLPTQSYTDLDGSLHDYYFTVAGALKSEQLVKIRMLVDKAIEKGISFNEFKKDFKQIAQKAKIPASRARVIYETNLNSSYNKGRLSQHLEFLNELPFWEYRHNQSPNPRENHQALNNIIRPADDPFWQIYYPVKAFNCHCTVIAHSSQSLKDNNLKLSPKPKITTDKNGNYQGYSKGFVPHNFDELKKHLKAQTIPQPSGINNIDNIIFRPFDYLEPIDASNILAKLIKQNEVINSLTKSFANFVNHTITNKQPSNKFFRIGFLAPQIIDKLTKLNLPPLSHQIIIRDKDLLHATRDTKQAKGLALPLNFWLQLPTLLQHPTAVLLQKKDQTRGKDPLSSLVYIFKNNNSSVAIKLDYVFKNTTIKDGKKTKTLEKANVLITGRNLDSIDKLEDFSAFEMIYKTNSASD